MRIKLLTVFFVFGVFSLVALLASTISFIRVDSVEGASYIALEDLSTGEVDYINNIEGQSVTKRVSKGGYRVSVISNEGTSVSFIKTAGFFNTTQITADIQKEGSREFIGEEPNECSLMLNNILVSYGCNGPISTIKAHLASSTTVSSYVKKYAAPDDLASIEGIVKINDTSAIAMVKRSVKQGITPPSQIFYELTVENNSPKLSFVSEATYLTPQTEYKFYQQGTEFILLSTDSSELYTGSDLASIKPSESKGLAGIQGLKLVDYDAKDSASLLHAERAKPNLSERDKKTEKTMVVITRGNEDSQVVPFEGESFKKVSFCLSNSICMLDYENVLHIMDDSLAPRTKISNISQFISDGETLYLQDSIGLLRMNSDLTAGSYVYVQDKYDITSVLKIDSSKFLVNIKGTGSSSALLIDSEVPAEVLIDKLVFDLRRAPNIKTIVPYRSIIFIVPDLGELVYNTETNLLDYDPVVVDSVRSSLTQSVIDSGIDTQLYQVVLSGL